MTSGTVRATKMKAASVFVFLLGSAIAQYLMCIIRYENKAYSYNLQEHYTPKPQEDHNTLKPAPKPEEYYSPTPEPKPKDDYAPKSDDKDYGDVKCDHHY
ncbi:hypothetical protein HDV06_005247 [Boothiomyces sp. JEL0866]|nr:hypothetical protein HDV06_005247 [Boothiomyces sp. JEL0866]